MNSTIGSYMPSFWGTGATKEPATANEGRASDSSPSQAYGYTEACSSVLRGAGRVAGFAGNTLLLTVVPENGYIASLGTATGVVASVAITNSAPLIAQASFLASGQALAGSAGYYGAMGVAALGFGPMTVPASVIIAGAAAATGGVTLGANVTVLSYRAVSDYMSQPGQEASTESETPETSNDTLECAAKPLDPKEQNLTMNSFIMLNPPTVNSAAPAA